MLGNARDYCPQCGAHKSEYHMVSCLHAWRNVEIYRVINGLASRAQPKLPLWFWEMRY